MTIAACPGSFDPVTLGHLDVVARAAQLFDEVVVLVVPNPSKAGLLEPHQRLALLREALGELDGGPGRVRAEIVVGGLLVDACREVGATAVVKGVRSAADVDAELAMARMNRHLSGLETVFLPADPRWQHVASSLVREVARLGGDVADMVPPGVADELARVLGRHG